MASVTLQVRDVFPPTTSVGAYSRSDWTATTVPSLGVAPPGSADTSATVAADGSLVFTGLTASTEYVASAQVSGVWTHRNFSAPASSGESVEGSTDTVDSRVLVTPTSSSENGLTVKAPDSNWGVGQSYGKGQAFELLKASASASDIGYAATTPDDLVLARWDAQGRIGCQGMHIASGLRQAPGYTDNYALKVAPWIDVPFMLMQADTSVTQTQPFLRGDSPASQEKFRITPAGNGMFGQVSSKGALVGDVGLSGSGFFGIAHSDNATSTNYALAQSAAGGVLINCATGQTIGFRINNVSTMVLSSTFFSLGAQYIQGSELAADPAAPGANSGRLYFRDNGAGKTQLCVIFNTGAVQVLATQP